MNSTPNPILALDIGKSRVGVAKLLIENSHIEPIGTVERSGGKAEKEILSICEKLSIDTIVAGLPLNEDGTEGVMCGEVRRFCKRLMKRHPLTVVFVDEYGSSFEAEERIGNASRGDKGMIDTHSAVIILERYVRNEGIIG